MVLLFPVGLLFLLITEETELQVTVRDTGAGSQIRLVGTTAECDGEDPSSGPGRPASRHQPAHDRFRHLILPG